MYMHTVTSSPTQVVIYTNQEVLVNKLRLSEFLESKSLEVSSSKSWLDYHPDSDYLDTFDFILKNLPRTSCIQIYQDGVIRLHLGYSFFDHSKKSIFIQDADILEDQSTKEAIEALISFSNSQ